MWNVFFSFKTDEKKENEIENKKKEKSQIIDKQPECTFVHMRLVFFERYFIGVYHILCTIWTHAHKPTVIIYDPNIKIKINLQMRIAFQMIPF